MSTAKGPRSNEPLWVQGEDIPRERLPSVFRGPPGIPARPPRSALIIGARGAGKTTYLRHLELMHRGTALRLSLGSDMSSIGEELPLGFLAVDSDPAEERAIVGKTVSLAAAWLAERATKQGVEVDPSTLMAAVPGAITGRVRRKLTTSSIAKIRADVEKADLEHFGSLSRARILQQFAEALGGACERQGMEPLLILLDRGDNVAPACLAAVFQLLDQSDGYTAVAAMRPGPSPPPQLVDMPASAAAGDHYDVFTLGARPRSPQWREFAEQTLRAQEALSENLDLMPAEVVEGVLILSRDSLREAVEALGRVLSAPPSQDAREAALDGLEDLAENAQLVAKKLLRQFHPDVTGMIRQLRSEMKEGGSAPGNPCLLSVNSPRQTSLLETTTDVDRLIAVGLRCGAFCLPEGTAWAPGDRPLEVEINPLLLWRREDGLPELAAKDAPIRLSKRSGELLGGGGRAKHKVSVFCAYRMQRTSSVSFLADLEREVRRHPALSSANVAVTNGNTEPGEMWAGTIRNRIQKARAVVADLTDMRPDVLFEAGFAYGCSTPLVPAVETADARDRVPSWLKERQVAVFSEPGGLSGIINRIVTILNDPRAARTGPPKPAPGKVVWLRALAWNVAALEQARATCNHEGLVIETYRPPGDVPLAHPPDGIEEIPVTELIEKAARANLLVVSLDGRAPDDLMHYVAGAVAARPKTSANGVGRRVLVVNEPTMRLDKLVADSLARVTEVVRLVEVDQVRDEVSKFAASYTKWAEKG